MKRSLQRCLGMGLLLVALVVCLLPASSPLPEVQSAPTPEHKAYKAPSPTVR